MGRTWGVGTNGAGARDGGVARDAVMAAFHLSTRLAAGFRLAVGPDRAAGTPALHAANAAWTLLDVAQWAYLRRVPHPPFAWRAALAAVDQAFWERHSPPGAGAPAQIAAPLAVEATTRRGLRGLAVPSTVAALVALAPARRTGPRSPAKQWLEPLRLAADGVLLRQVRRAHYGRATAAHEQRLAARTAQAFLAGEHAVAMGADSVVDALEGVAPLLGRPQPGSALHDLLDSWKASLAAEARKQATYLGVALAKWQRVHNLHPDLASHVDVRLPEGRGTMLLTGTQARAVTEALDARGLRGHVEVDLDGDEPRPPGDAFVLRVAGRPLPVEADAGARLREYDVSPMVLAGGALVALGVAAGDAVPVPAWRRLPAAAVFAAGVFAARQRLLAGRSRPPRALATALAGAALDGFLTVRAQRAACDRDGRAQPVLKHALEPPTFLAGYYASDAPVLAAAGAAGAAAVFGATFLPRRRGVGRAALVEASLLASRFALGIAIGRAIRRETAELQAEFDATEQAALDAAFEAGRASVLGLVTRARAEAGTRYDAVKGTLDEALRGAAERRLRDVDDRLLALGAARPA